MAARPFWGRRESTNYVETETSDLRLITCGLLPQTTAVECKVTVDSVELLLLRTSCYYTSAATAAAIESRDENG